MSLEIVLDYNETELTGQTISPAENLVEINYLICNS